MGNTYDRVLAVLKNTLYLDHDPQPGDSLVEDLDADSLDACELEIDLETEFDLDLESVSIDKKMTVQDVVDLVERLR